MLSEKNTYGVLKKYCGRVEIRIKSVFGPCEKNTYRDLKKYDRARRNPYKIRLKFKKPGGLWWNFLGANLSYVIKAVGLVLMIP